MPRSKSIPGSKTNRAKTNNEQTDVGSTPNFSEANRTAEGAADVSPESKIARDATKERTVTEAMPVARAAESKGGSDNRKFEVVKTESRKNLVPINLEDEIRRRAYELYEQRGAGSGSEVEDWFAAEREVKQRYRQQIA
jgi:hypothetical protein